MYPISPVYVNRQYAVSDGMYKVHAASRITAPNRQSGKPLYDMLLSLQSRLDRQQTKEDAPPARKDASQQGDVADQAPLETSTSRQLVTQGMPPGNRPLPAGSPLDRASRSTPFNPYGRFREFPFDAANPPQRPADSARQSPFAKRHAAMVNAYEPSVRYSGTLDRVM